MSQCMLSRKKKVSAVFKTAMTFENECAQHAIRQSGDDERNIDALAFGKAPNGNLMIAKNMDDAKT